MLTSNHLYLPKNGQTTGQLIIIFQYVRLKVKYWFGQIGYVIILIFFSPIIVIMWLRHKISNYFFIKYLDTLKDNLSTVSFEYLLDNYKEMRTEYNKSDFYLSKIKAITNDFLNEPDHDFFTCYFNLEIKKYIFLRQDYLNTIDKALSRLDENTPKGTNFQLTLENELWQNRNKIYQYKI